MRSVRNIPFIIIFCIAELFFVPFPFIFIALFLCFTFYSEEEALFLAFLSGLLFDMLLLKTFGTTSMLFMVLLFATSLYRRKYEVYNLFFLGIAVFLSILIIEFTYSKTIALQSGLFGMVVTMILARFYVPTSQKYESWYRIS